MSLICMIIGWFRTIKYFLKTGDATCSVDGCDWQDVETIYDCKVSTFKSLSFNKWKWKWENFRYPATMCGTDIAFLQYENMGVIPDCVVTISKCKRCGELEYQWRRT